MNLVPLSLLYIRTGFKLIINWVQLGGQALSPAVDIVVDETALSGLCVPFPWLCVLGGREAPTSFTGG